MMQWETILFLMENEKNIKRKEMQRSLTGTSDGK